MEDWQQRIGALLRGNRWIAGLLLLGLGVFLAGRVIGFMSEENEVEIIAEEVVASNGSVWVDIEGAVVKPGVYELGNDARVKDALLAAGGLSEEADRNRIARNLNLAAKVNDGEKIYIVSEGEVSESEVLGGSDSAKIKINSASPAVLDKLWGVGPARAQEIIAGRPYASIEDLKNKGVVPSNVFERIKDQIEL